MNNKKTILTGIKNLKNADKKINDRGSCLGEYGRRNGEFS